MSYLPTHTLHLEVEARNSLNALAISLQNEIRRTLSVYEGKKVVKTTPYPGWTARVKIGMDLIPLPDRHHLYYTFTERRVWADLKTWYEIPGQSGVNYVKKEFFHQGAGRRNPPGQLGRNRLLPHRLHRRGGKGGMGKSPPA